MIAVDFASGDPYSVMMNIKGKNGAWISDFTRSDVEQEILFKHGTRFKVLNRTMRGNRLTLDLAEI